MEEMRIKVEYDGKYFNTELDKKIQKAIESIGAKWYAQGHNYEDDIRDICFILEVE